MDMKYNISFPIGDVTICREFRTGCTLGIHAQILSMFPDSLGRRLYLSKFGNDSIISYTTTLQHHYTITTPLHYNTKKYMDCHVKLLSHSQCLKLTSCTSWNFIIFWKPIIFHNFMAMSFKNHWLTSYQNIYSNISFPKAVNKTCPCGVTIFTSHHKFVTSSRLLQGYYIKVYQGYYVTVTLTNHFKIGRLQMRKNAFLLIGESWE